MQLSGGSPATAGTGMNTGCTCYSRVQYFIMLRERSGRSVTVSSESDCRDDFLVKVLSEQGSLQ